jgi:hypothetical protein
VAGDRDGATARGRPTPCARTASSDPTPSQGQSSLRSSAQAPILDRPVRRPANLLSVAKGVLRLAEMDRWLPVRGSGASAEA